MHSIPAFYFAAHLSILTPSFRALIMEMSLLSLNLNKGFGDSFKQAAIRKFTLKDDFLLLQETRSLGKITYLKNTLHRSGKFSSFSKEARGCAALCKNDIRISQSWSDEEGRIAALLAHTPKTTVGVVSVYMPNLGPPSSKDIYLNTLDRLSSILTQIKKITPSIVVGGDFNCIMDPTIDAERPSAKTYPEISSAISELFDSFDMVDSFREIYPDRKAFTYSPLGDNSSKIYRRLDYFYVSSDLCEVIKDVEIVHCHFSDHKAIRLTLNFQGTCRLGKGYWRHNDQHLERAEYRQKVSEKLERIELDFDREFGRDADPVLKWEYMKFSIAQACRRYAAEENISVKERISLLEAQLVELETDPLENTAEINLVKQELHGLLRIEEERLIFKSRVKWHEVGEKASREFYRSLKENNRDSNVILLKENGKDLPESKINSSIEKYYKSLLREYPVDRIGGSMAGAIEDIPKVSNINAAVLGKPITIPELTTTLFQRLNPGKSPGSDGLTVAFYKTFWDKLKFPFFRSLSSSIESGSLSNSQRRSIVRLIRKKDKDPADIKNWRPISLINCDVKIFSRLLAARLDLATRDIISPEQLAFVKDRNIFDGIRYISYAIDHLERNNEEGLVASFDMQKAFDSISHQYLWDLLARLNFPEQFTGYLKTLYNGAESVVLNNGLVTGPVPLGRSCRQGDCISPTLFILSMEPLIRLINRNPNIKGISPFGRNKKISVYADDITGFMSGTNDLVETIGTIGYFGRFTGLKLNEQKTEILKIGNVRDTVPSTFEKYKCVENIKITGIYFSLSRNENLNEKLNFEAAINKSRINFNRWSSRNISIFGRTLLAKSHGLAQIQFLANAIEVPAWAIAQMKQIIYKFIWKGVDKITRNLASKPIKEGGINLPILDDLCRAAGIQWLRKVHRSHLPWIDFLKHDIIKNGGLSSFNNKRTDKEIRLNSTYSFNSYLARCWRDTRALTEINSNSVLNEVLWNNKKFAYLVKSKKMVPESVLLLKLGYSRVGDFFDNDGRIIEAEDAVRRGIPRVGVIEWASAIRYIKKYLQNRSLALLRGFNSPNTVLHPKDFMAHELSLLSDGIDYTLDSLSQKAILTIVACSRKETGKFLSNQLILSGSPDTPHNISKRIKAFSNCTKNRSFAFKLINGLIYSNKELAKFGYTTEDYCSFCKVIPDSRDHMLLDCIKIRKLRRQVYQKFSLSPSRFEEWFGTGNRCDDYILFSLNKLIYHSKVAESAPTLGALLGAITKEYQIEYKIAEKNGTLICHLSKWQNLKNKLGL